MTREEAIKILKAIRVYECYPKSASEETKEVIDMAIEALSADVVEVIRCKDCKWHLNGHLCKQLSQYGSIETPPSFYCGFAERRVQCQE